MRRLTSSPRLLPQTTWTIPAAELVKSEFLLCLAFAVTPAVLPSFSEFYVYGPEWSRLVELLGHAAYWVLSFAAPAPGPIRNYLEETQTGHAGATRRI